MTGVYVVVVVGERVLVGVKLQTGIMRVIPMLILSVFRPFIAIISSFEMENWLAMLASVSFA